MNEMVENLIFVLVVIILICAITLPIIMEQILLYIDKLNPTQKLIIWAIPSLPLILILILMPTMAILKKD